MLAVVKGDPRTNPGMGLAAISVTLQVDVLVLKRAPQPLDKQINTLSIQRPRPSIEMRTPAARSTPVKAALVNGLPWSVLKISGRPKRASASCSAETQNEVSLERGRAF
jgi:hypothetical protein